MEFKDYYEILEVHRKASIEVIQKAYKTLALKYHPDRNLNNIRFAEEKMKELNEAYEVLSNSLIRENYNKVYDNHFGKQLNNSQTNYSRSSEPHNEPNNYQQYSQKENTQNDVSGVKHEPAKENRKVGFKLKYYIISTVLIVLIIIVRNSIIDDIGSNNTNTSSPPIEAATSSNSSSSAINQTSTNSSNTSTISSGKTNTQSTSTVNKPITASKITSTTKNTTTSGKSSTNSVKNTPSTTNKDTSTSTSSNNIPKKTTSSNYITIGYTKDEVTKIMGTPSSVNDYFWSYGISTIYFSSNLVSGWSNVEGNLKVTLGNKVQSAPPVTIGSSKKDVINAMGTPSCANNYFWSYGISTIDFNNGVVSGWSNTEGNLKVSLGNKINGAPPIAIGSSKKDVVNTMGTPSSINDYFWSYGISTIDFNNGVVSGWDNTEGNLILK